MTDPAAPAIHAAIPSSAARTGVRVALLTAYLANRRAAISAARRALRDRVRATDAWNEADGMRRELARQTEGTRKELRSLLAASREAVEDTEEGREVVRLRGEIKHIQGRIDEDLRGEVQGLLGFAREVGAEE